MTTVRFDLHVHTHHSFDCLTRPEQLVEVVQRNGLTGIAVTDHNAIEGALHLRDVAPFPVIVGEEVETTHGEIAGLFLGEWIPPRLSPQETIDRIKAQGGLVYITHPLAHGVPSRIRQRVLREILPQVDLIEGFNARVPLPADDRRVRELAGECGIPLGAGSDAHFAAEVGRGYVELEPFAVQFSHTDAED